MFGANFFGGQDMFRRAAAPQPYFLAMQPQKRSAERTDRRRKDQSFPEYIVDVTRNSLLSFTTSLTKVTTQAHDFFARVNTVLAFERMMRDCMSWFMPGLGTPAPTSTTGVMPMGFAVAQMWGVPDPLARVPQWKPQAQLPKAPTWFGADWLTSAKPKAEPKPAPAPQATADLPILGAFLALPAAFLAMTPSLMQAWNLTV